MAILFSRQLYQDAMIPATLFAGKTVAVFGLGLSGLAAVKSLVAGGATVVAWDDAEKNREAAREHFQEKWAPVLLPQMRQYNAGARIEDLRIADWRQFAALILAPGVPLTHPEPHWAVGRARKAGIEIIGDTEIFCRERRHTNTSAQMLAITGTNGKSTTTALVQHLLKMLGVDAVLGGNIGEAVLGLPAFDDTCVYVLEFSSFQLDLTPSLDADGAILLNLALDHLDRHGTMDHYAAIKAKIFKGLRPNAFAVIGADDGYCDNIAASVAATGHKVLRISAQTPVRDGVYAKGSQLLKAQGGEITHTLDLSGIRSLRGAHNAQNAAAALALLCALGFPWQALSEAIKSFPGLPHRMEEVRRAGHILFINDSKATNADAAERALLSFHNIYWILGGKAKAGGIAPLSPHFPRVKKAYLIGEAAPAFAETLGKAVPHVMSGTLEKAIAHAAKDAAADRSGEAVVLLSPACASYDQFPNFEVRGNAFRELALGLEI